MGVFGEANPFDESVEKVTAETLTSENWALMMDICDRVTAEGGRAAKYCLTSVKKRLNHRDPHVVLLALSLIDCLWSNCGPIFRREVSSKEFISELNYKATSSNRVVAERTRELIKSWAENECRKDSSLSLVESLYKDLLDAGHSFESSEKSANQKKKITYSNDPNVVHTEQEEADIAKAIALSLNEVKDKREPIKQFSYPVFNDQQSAMNTPLPAVKRQVKALYDFEAVEDNELSFNTGDLLTLLDDSDANWWRGTSNRGTGLFPASFVTTDLEAPIHGDSGKPTENDTPTQSVAPVLPRVEINEEILQKCIDLLEGCDPTGQAADPPELAYYEQMSMAQGPLIDQKLAQIDKQHNMLAQIDVAIRDVLATYDNAVQQVQYQMQHTYNPPPNAMVGSVPSAHPPANGQGVPGHGTSVQPSMQRFQANPQMAPTSQPLQPPINHNIS
ncbi:VHS domain-containing protein [Ditylenchus destructor]|nr:VHS domain-containing protein [Ditylenchus destructor]